MLVITTATTIILEKINLVTKSCTSLINNLLKDLLDKNSENANIICDFIIAERNF